MGKRRYTGAINDSSLVYVKPEVTLGTRVRHGLLRRAKQALFPQDKRVRRIPFGLARGLRYRTNVAGPPYRYVGLFEYEISRRIRELTRRGRRCWDVGGADGYYALIFSKLTRERVVTFEADAGRCEQLAEMCAENPGIGERIDIRRNWVAAESDGNGRVALDDLPDAPPDVLKIDVEGGEYDVLRGADRILRGRRPDVVIEVHSAVLEHQCLTFLLDHGYAPTVIGQRRHFRENRPLAHNRWIVAEPAGDS